MFEELKEAMKKELKKRTTSQQIGEINKEAEIVKGNQTKILELVYND